MKYSIDTMRNVAVDLKKFPLYYAGARIVRLRICEQPTHAF